ncbi:helix-turn-helix domain-containing protein [Saccharomonospora viridis]|uniref:XRE family transcriptional regulator n=1 Tax=Saccharomonospora viridis TaxID=1852 RepID=A0A837DHA2_9PSEU|nr:helix-turn-helix transcriptional regulator [Saccharomonospora viridis]KHF45841.1 XRE family transcriptional regulator [Saccharomonospora viridis]SFP41443.1 Helix-turn-helix domain-containing protein [Saccharomonospora viridis]
MNTIGATIRRLRRWRGLTIEQAAGLAGITKGYLSKIENGRVAVDKRSTLVAIADALRVSLVDITGDGLEIRDPEADSTVPAIRAALLDSDFDDSPARGELSALVAEAQLVAAMRQANQVAEAGRRLPPLITALHTHTRQAEALRALVSVAHTTSLLVKGLGAPDLAWIAADRGHEAAERLGDPHWIALAAFARTQAHAGLGAHRRAGTIARNALEIVPDDAVDVRGALTLTTALTDSVVGSDPSAALDEAEGLVAHVEDGNRHHLLFTAPNVVLWRMATALEQGDYARAATLAESIHPTELEVNSRRTTYFIDYARALWGLRRPDEEVVALLTQAEKLGPVRTRSNAFVREIVSTMVERARHQAVAREARGLASRMGLLKAG